MLVSVLKVIPDPATKVKVSVSLSAATADPLADPDPEVTPKLENALAAVLVFAIVTFLGLEEVSVVILMPDPASSSTFSEVELAVIVV